MAEHAVSAFRSHFPPNWRVTPSIEGFITSLKKLFVDIYQQAYEKQRQGANNAKGLIPAE